MINPKSTIGSLFRTPEGEFSTRYGKIRLDRSERTLPFQKTLMAKIRERVTDDLLMIYPEPDPLYREMSEFLGISRDHLLFHSGSDLCIKTVYETYIRPDDKILLHDPSYAMYSVYASMFGATVELQEYINGYRFCYGDFLSKVNKKLRMVAFENPNGFTGTLPDRSFLEELTKLTHSLNILLVIDEAYHFFTNNTVLDLVDKYPNLIISRTFSKALGLASCRIGYLIANPKTIAQLKKVRPMHELTQFSIISAQEVLRNFAIVEKNVKETLSSLLFLKENLKQRALDYSPSVANFLIAKLELKDEENFLTQLEENKFLIRRPFSQPNLLKFRRLGVSSQDDLKHFLEILDANSITKKTKRSGPIL